MVGGKWGYIDTTGRMVIQPMALSGPMIFTTGWPSSQRKLGSKSGSIRADETEIASARAAAEHRINGVDRDTEFPTQQVASSILAGGPIPSNYVYPINAWAKRKAHWCWVAASDISSWRNST
jgi:hypothetical protein